MATTPGPNGCGSYDPVQGSCIDDNPRHPALWCGTCRAFMAAALASTPPAPVPAIGETITLHVTRPADPKLTCMGCNLADCDGEMYMRIGGTTGAIGFHDRCSPRPVGAVPASAGTVPLDAMHPCANCGYPLAGHGPGAEPPIACDDYRPESTLTTGADLIDCLLPDLDHWAASAVGENTRWLRQSRVGALRELGAALRQHAAPAPAVEESSGEADHCDDYITDYRQPNALRWFLLVERLPASEKMVAYAMGARPRLFADYKGKRVRVVMASRMGDVGITPKLSTADGYEKRVAVGDLANFGDKP